MNNKLLETSKNPHESKISVVVPVYNAAKTLRECLNALKNQTDSNYEVILVNDHSTDNSLAICKESGFRILNLAVNKGQAVARNEGVKEVKGEIIVFTDSDVIVPQGWLREYRRLLALYKDADMICSEYSASAEDTEPAIFAFYETLYRRLNLPLYINSSTSSNCVIYKKAFEEVGGYPEYYINLKLNTANQKAVATNEDAELGFLLTQKGKKIVWSHDNPVRHYFRNSWTGYLKQQIGFSRYGILSIFKFPKKLFNQNIFSKERIVSQLIIISLILLAPLGLFFKDTGLFITLFMEITSFLAFYLIHRNFICYLKKNIRNYHVLRLFSWLIISRVCWLYGVILGLKDGCRMLWSNYWHRLRNKIYTK